MDAGKTPRHDEIYSHIHGGEYNDWTAKNIVYNSTKRLRQKIRKDAKRDYIQTIYDVGYMLFIHSRLHIVTNVKVSTIAARVHDMSIWVYRRNLLAVVSLYLFQPILQGIFLRVQTL